MSLSNTDSGAPGSGSGAMLSAMFDTRSDAESALQRLVEAGVPRGSIHLLPDSGGSAEPAASGHETGGFFQALADFFLPDEDRHTFAEGLHRGGFLLTLRAVTPALHDRAVEILDKAGAVNIDERVSSWRTQGWTGHYSGATDGTVQHLGPSDHVGQPRGYAESALDALHTSSGQSTRDSSLSRANVRSYRVGEPGA